MMEKMQQIYIKIQPYSIENVFFPGYIESLHVKIRRQKKSGERKRMDRKMSGRKIEIALVLAMAGLYFFSFFQRVAIPGTLFNELQTTFLISASEVTRLGAIYLFVYASLQPFAGYLADRFGGVRVILVSGVLLVAGATWFPCSRGLTELYLSRALVGVGASMMYLCLVKEADRCFHGRNFAPFFGFLCFIGYTGGLVGTRPFRGLVEYAGWQKACLVAALGTLVTLAVTALIARKAGFEPVKRGRPDLLKSIGGVLKNPLNLPVLLTTPLCFAFYFTLQATIGTKFLEDFCGISSVSASNYTFAMMLCTITAMFFSGMVSRHLGNKRRIFVLFIAVSATASMLLLLCGTLFRLPPWVFLIAYILPAISAGYTPVTVSLLKELNHSEKAGISVGVMNTVTYMTVAVMTQLTGRILDIFRDNATVSKGIVIYPQSAYVTLFAILLGLSALPLISSFFCRETNGENIFREPSVGADSTGGGKA